MGNYIYQGHLARKRFGQNFLHDHHMIESIITAIQPQTNQALVEIGPGLGALTKPVMELVKSLVVIELDHDLSIRLVKHPVMQQKLHILQQDAMTVDFAALSTMTGQSLRIFGNLPYNISTQLMFYLFRYTHVIYDMHFMLQKEVVHRLVANPNSKNYGRLSIMTQYYCKVIPVLEVSSSSFIPKPKVNSVLVRLIPHTNLPYQVRNLHKLVALTNLAFSQRRKTIRNSLASLFSIEQLMEQGIDITLRAENMSIEQYCRLANVLAEKCIVMKE